MRQLLAYIRTLLALLSVELALLVRLLARNTDLLTKREIYP
ncbi:hypothetical protein MKY37_03320 [Psychrobacillus sp. FSL K6-2836]